MDVRTSRRRARPALLLAVVLGLVASIAATPARAAVPFKDISTAGPMEHIYLGDELSCQVKLVGDDVLSFYPSTVIPGDCGTFLHTGGTLYYPKFGLHGGTATTGLPAPKTTFTTVSQTPVSGTGTAGDPYTVTTVADAGATGLRVTQVDSYATGADRYLTEITVSNSGASTQTAALYHAADCFLANTDDGFGWVDAATEGVFCTANPNNSPPNRVIGFQPAGAASAGPTYLETRYDLLWPEINGTTFPNACSCTTSLDNGAGLEWDITVPAGGEVTRALHTTVFAPLRFSIADAQVVEGNTPLSRGVPIPTDMRFRITLAPAADHAVKIDYATADGSAIAAADYEAKSGTLNFPAGTTVRTLRVPINGDHIDEFSENFTVTLSNPTGGAIIEDGTATGRIGDDDPAPHLSVGDTSLREGRTHQVPIFLSTESGKVVRVSYATQDGTGAPGESAFAPEDYTPRSGTVVFPAGVITKLINVSTVQDSAQENWEQFTLDISAPVNATISDPSGTLTIENDDAD